MADKDKDYQHTAYDDAFRTMEEECDDALIGFVNHMFHENYDSSATIIRLRNEHYVEHKGEKNEKKITDSHFQIIFHGKKKEYHLECESSGYSETMLVKLFQYAVQTALGEHKRTHDRIVVSIPCTGLLVLRDKGTPPKFVTFEIHTPGGTVSYKVPVICETDYRLDELFERKLYFLLPFYIFNLENRLDDFERDKQARKEFEKIFCDIIERIGHAEEADLSLRSKGVIIKQMGSVAMRLAEKRIKVSERIGDIMGGQVVKMDWLERFDAAVAEGKMEGAEQVLIRQVCRKLRKGKSVSQIAEDLEEDVSNIEAICEAAKEFAPEYDEGKIAERLGDRLHYRI